jgi:uncharacterized protein with WD repeat
MVTDISVLGTSTRISVGQYNHSTQTLQLWVYATRFEKVGNDKFASVPDFDLAEYKACKKVELIDIDWDSRYQMTYSQFKKAPVKDGVRKINMSKLQAI